MRLYVMLSSAKLTATDNNQNISFLPAIVSTSTRMHGEFLRLLFLQAHRETEAAFYQNLKSKVGLALGGQSSDVEDQPQCRGLWHSSSPSTFQNHPTFSYH